MEVALWIWALFSVGVLAVLLVDLARLPPSRPGGHRSAEAGRVDTGVWLRSLRSVSPGSSGPGRETRPATAVPDGLPDREEPLDRQRVRSRRHLRRTSRCPSEYRHRALLWGVIGALVLRAMLHRCRGRRARAVRLDASTSSVSFLVSRPALRLAVSRDRSASRHEPQSSRLIRKHRPDHARGSTASGSSSASNRHLTGDADACRAHRRRHHRCRLRRRLGPGRSSPSPTTPFLVFAANAFSVLGMLALYFLLAEMIGRFRYLRPALAAILVFVGLKMAASDVYDVPGRHFVGGDRLDPGGRNSRLGASPSGPRPVERLTALANHRTPATPKPYGQPGRRRSLPRSVAFWKRPIL